MLQVDVLEYYETSVRSASAQFLIPAVLRVRMYVSKRELKSGRLSLSRRNILLRDNGQCQCVSHRSAISLRNTDAVLDPAPCSAGSSYRAIAWVLDRSAANPALIL